MTRSFPAMVFVPLPLFGVFVLIFVLVRLVLDRDMGLWANRLFAVLVALYAVQSGLLTLRWGYGVQGARMWIAVLAPVLPVVAYLAFRALTGRLVWWPLVVIGANWAVFGMAQDWADAMIPATYLAFGGLILWRAFGALPVTRINAEPGARRAMVLTGAALIASALTDVWVIYDFVTNDGARVGMTVTLVQVGFVLAMGVAAGFGEASEEAAAEKAADTSEDAEIIARLETLFQSEGLHRSEDLSLRRLSRRLGMPDRAVSGAINRTRGVNVSQFVNEYRVRDACELLENTDQTVLQISLAAGFSTKSNFNREFSRVTGQTPTGWRKARA